jgi:hypothetical protein
MQLNNDATELILIEGDAPEFEDFNLGTEIAKSLVLSTAQTAGVVGGFVVVAIALEVGTKLHKRFFKKTETDKVPDITTMPKATEN